MLSLVPSGWRAGARVAEKRAASRVWRLSAWRCYARGTDWLAVDTPPVQPSKDEDGAPVFDTYRRASIPVRRVNNDIAGTVTIAKPAETGIQDLLAKVESVDSTSETQTPFPTGAVLIVLLSASYARHAVDDAFALRLMEKLRPGHAQALQAFIAVVDRIPSSTGTLTGSEGFAYYYQHRPDLRPIHGSLKPFDQKAQNPGSISFQISPSELRNTSYTIQVPLAQTVFSTGLVSTMIQYEYAPSDDDTLQTQRKRLLESLTVPLGFTEPDTWLRMFTPLIPLTPARVVRNSMGNIVRTLSQATVRAEHKKGSLPSGPQPASTELEEAVARYFKALNIPPEPVQVWALIMPFTRNLVSLSTHQNLIANPRERWLRWLEPDQIQQFWVSKAGETQHPPQGAVSAAIMGLVSKTGGRLCRVLSGGGGWGKKAGLLSLDPDVKYSVRDLRSDKGWEFNLETEEAAAKSKQQALGEVVTEGNEIQFFIAPKEAGYSEQDELLNSGLYPQEYRSAVFGAIPSTIDTAPDSAAETKSKSVSAPATLHERGMFGALSETGLALTTGLRYPQSDHPSAPRATPIKSITKFDVPFSKIRIGQGAGSRLAEYRSPDEINSQASEALLVELGEEIKYFEAAADADVDQRARQSRHGDAHGLGGRRAYSTQSKPLDRTEE